MTEPWTEDDIAAFVDGALEGAERDRVARLIECDPAARAAAERIREANALLRDAFAAPLSEPTPAAMAALFDETGVVRPFTPRPAPRASWAPAALAAGVALVVGSVGGALLAPRPGAPTPERATLSVGPAPEALAAALYAAPSGTLQGGVRPIASFPVEGGGYCREFELQESAEAAPTAFGLACGMANGWRVVVAADIAGDAAGASGGFAPASGAAIDAASPILDDLGAGPALDVESERRAISARWK